MTAANTAMQTAMQAESGPSRRMPEKRRAIMSAARTAFGREGYTRCSVDTIAAEAGVSKRTIYNHFADKEQLFQTVVLQGAGEVAQLHASLADRHLRKIVDLRQDLTDFALDRIAALSDFADHWALVRTIEAESGRINPTVLNAWLEAGPRETHRELTRRMVDFAERGLIRVDDPAQSARLFNLLTFIAVTQPSFYGAVPLPKETVHRFVDSGVDAFLRLHT